MVDTCSAGGAIRLTGAFSRKQTCGTMNYLYIHPNDNKGIIACCKHNEWCHSIRRMPWLKSHMPKLYLPTDAR